MNIEVITIFMILTFLSLLTIGLSFAWAMGATACLFTFFLYEPNVLLMPMMRIFDFMQSESLMAIPLFIFMASILEKAGVAEKLFKAIYVWSGKLRGGLAVATLIGCIIMAAMVGIVGAEIVTFGLIALPAMNQRGYHNKISLGSITSGGGLATLIPPSIVFIVYALMTNCPLGDLFIAGVIPGLALGVAFIIYVIVACYIHPDWAPAAPESERNISLKDKLSMLKELVMPVLISIFVLGSIYAGIATPAESAAVGCAASILASIVNRKFEINHVKTACHETIIISSMLMWMFFGAQTIIGFYTLVGGGDFVKHSLIALDLGPMGTVLLMNAILILLGMFIDWIGILLLTMPLFAPILKDFGYDLVWFGVVFCMNMHIAYLSPPFGQSVLVMASLLPKDFSVWEVYKANFPYLFITVLILAITIAFPAFSMWLPSLMR
jgi:tripartite ATP-independent transporter DctM subunit